jgi:hypothetical protein
MKYTVTITTTAQRPRFFFPNHDEVNLNPVGGGDRKGSVERSFPAGDVRFELHIIDVTGTAFALTIEEAGKEVFKKPDGMTDKPNCVFRDKFKHTEPVIA